MLWMQRALMLVAAVCAGASGCGGASTVSSCTITATDAGAGTLPLLCVEAPSVAQGYALCMPSSFSGGADGGPAVHASFDRVPCPHVGTLGACRIPGQGTFWYYQDGSSTPADISTRCASLGGTYVPP